MNITYDKALKQRVFQAVSPKLYNDMCPFCGAVITGKNFAGAAWVDQEFRAFDGNIVCLIALSDVLRSDDESSVS